jgi:hypothetical protein
VENMPEGHEIDIRKHVQFGVHDGDWLRRIPTIRMPACGLESRSWWRSMASMISSPNGAMTN